MQIKDLFNRVKNSKNNQSVWNPKKRKLKEIGWTEEDILNMKVDKKFKELMK